MKNTYLWGPGEKPCDHCGTPLPDAIETWKGHPRVYCGSEEYQIAAAAKPRTKWVSAGEVACIQPKCGGIAPAGWYDVRTVNFVCSIKCWHKLHFSKFAPEFPFVCDWCGESGVAQRNPNRGGLGFCSNEHAGRYRREQNSKSSGKYRQILDTYLKTFVSTHYRVKSVPTHINAVVSHLRFLDESGIDSLDSVSARTVSDYGEWLQKKGSPTLLSTKGSDSFFSWLWPSFPYHGLGLMKLYGKSHVVVMNLIEKALSTSVLSRREWIRGDKYPARGHRPDNSEGQKALIRRLVPYGFSLSPLSGHMEDEDLALTEKERLAHQIENMAISLAMRVMDMAKNEEQRRWLLTRCVQRVLHHLELNLGPEVDKQAILAGRGTR